MPAPPWLYVGRVVAPFGIKGEVRAMLETEFPDHLTERPVYMGDDHRPIRVERVRLHRREALLKLGGVDTPDDADKLRGRPLYIATADAVPLPEGRYYFHQIVGLQVFTTTGERYGEVRDVLPRPANDIYVVLHAGTEVLVPAIADVVKSIDVGAGRMVIDPIPGLE